MICIVSFDMHSFPPKGAGMPPQAVGARVRGKWGGRGGGICKPSLCAGAAGRRARQQFPVGGYLLTAMARVRGYLLTVMATVGGYLLLASVPDPDPPDPHVFGPPGSGSISQWHGSTDPGRDPHQNVMDPEHCLRRWKQLGDTYLQRWQQLGDTYLQRWQQWGILT